MRLFLWAGMKTSRARSVAHLEIKDGKIWIQEDNTESGIATDLEAAGVPKEDIVLGFRHRAEAHPLLSEHYGTETAVRPIHSAVCRYQRCDAGSAGVGRITEIISAGCGKKVP